jgi:HD-GYP domain-containing protein (c-di-GMP phosphodiesterase class II)
LSPAPASIQAAGDVGRLPTPAAGCPIPPADFSALAAAWRQAGLWLTLWNRDGSWVAKDEQAPRFWTTLFAEGSPAARQLAAFAADALRAHTLREAGPADPRADDPGPWQPDLGVLAAPILTRNRVTGLVLAAARLSARPGEAFARLCTQSRLDQAAMLGLGEALPLFDARSLAALAQPLRHATAQSARLGVDQEELSALTRNLESTYEELNLIYQISGQMSLSRAPAEVLTRIGRQLLEISRAQGIAFLLPEAQTQVSGGLSATSHPPHETDRIIQVGRCAPSIHDLDRLAECLDLHTRSSMGHLLLNQAARKENLRWAAGWLDHLVALPLWQGDRLLGLLLAINCSDQGDFTSIDVQLFRAVADRVTLFLDNQRLYGDLAGLLMALLHALINSIDAKDPYTCGHSERVACFSRALAEAVGLSPAECERVYLSGLLHDVGKIGVPDAILCKPGKLTPEEFDILRRHPEIGARILSPIRQIQDLLPGVLHHHERMDGRGYPAGLEAGAIPLLGRIICLADCFDAMTTNRTYRAAMPIASALAEIRRCSGTQFDPALAEAFLALDLPRLFEETRAFTGTDASPDPLLGLRVAVDPPGAGRAVQSLAAGGAP